MGICIYMIAFPLWLLGFHRFVLEPYFEWDVKAFMGHVAYPLFTVALVGFLWFFIWMGSSSDNQWSDVPH